MLFRHNGSDSTNTAFLDDVLTTTAGFGTDFRALSANSYTATVGAAASLTIAQIVFTYSPRETIARDGTNVVIVGTGGPPGTSYHLLASTNLALPMSQWTPITTDLFDGSGSFRYTNAINATSRRQFFRTALP